MPEVQQQQIRIN